MKISDKISDLIMIFEVVGWVGAVVAAMCDFAWAWMIVVVLMPMTLILNGSRHDGVFSKKLLGIPFIGYCLCQLIAMIGEIAFHLRFMEAAPTFTILGMHPSEFFLYFFYWIGSFICLGVGLGVKANDWCPQEDWDEFMAVIEKEKEVKH